MTQDPNPRPDRGTQLPPVDQVIYDIRESEGHLRSPEAVEPLPGSRAPGGPAEVSSAQTPTPSGTAAAAAAAGTGHEPSGHAPGHAAVAQHAAAGHADAGHDDAGHDEHGHASGEELGPVDTANWGAGILGVLVGLVIVACFAIATQGLGAY